jgi:acyl carrier protein
VNHSDLEHLLADLVGSIVEIAPDKIDRDARFDRYGIDSAAAISLAEELEQRLGRPLESTLLYDYPTIRTLAAFLGGAPR